MNRPFWSLRRTETDPCESIEPLLPLYADRMASPEEMCRIEAHLPSCEGCREALAWMQATHRALAARPVALPPADLHSRIAQAIAVSSAAPLAQTPGVLRPARSFRLRPAYAAAASLTVVGLILSLSQSLRHTPSQTVVHPAPRPAPFVAAVPSVSTPKPALPHPFSAHSMHHQPQVASVVREAEKPAARPVSVPRRAAPTNLLAPKEQVAKTIPAFVPRLMPARAETVRPSAAAPHDKIASTKSAPPQQRQPVEKALFVPNPPVISKLPDVAVIARHDKETPPVPIKILPFTVTTQPQVQTASAHLKPEPDNPMKKLADFAIALRTAPYARNHFMARQASSGIASAVQSSLDASDHVAYYGAIHSDTATK